MYLQCKTFKWKTAYEGDHEVRLSPEYQFNEFAKENNITTIDKIDVAHEDGRVSAITIFYLEG